MVLGHDNGKGENIQLYLLAHVSVRIWPTCVNARAQAHLIQERLLNLTEAHVHTLVNMMQCDIVVMSQSESRLQCMMYQPGYTPAKEVTRFVLREMLQKPVPPVFMHLNVQSSHFNALLPRKQTSVDGDDEATDNLIELDD